MTTQNGPNCGVSSSALPESGQARRTQTGFWVVVSILLVAGLGLNSAVQRLQLHFKKQAVPLVQPLDKLPAVLGHWVQVSKDEPLDAETQTVLATDKFIFRDYLDERVVGKKAIEEFNDKSFRERKELVARVQSTSPNAVISLGLTYYTGMVDTVAHIPDRCYIADGYEPSEYTVEHWSVAKEPAPVDVRFIKFEDQTGLMRRAVTKNVAYFFHVNGSFQSSPLEVRKSLQSLLQRYGYYAKIELMTLVRDRGESATMMRDFLDVALPKIKEMLPDWKNYQTSK